MLLTPAQVHAQQHLGPVLRLGAPGTRLDIEEGIVGVEFTGEHPPKLELGHAVFEVVDVRGDSIHRFGIALFHRHLEQIGAIGEPGLQLIHVQDDAFEHRPFLTEGLGPFLVVPDVRVFEFAQHLGQALLLGLVVKDTP